MLIQAAFFLVLLGIVLLFIFQEKLLYAPQFPAESLDPADFGLKEVVEEVWVEEPRDKLRLNGWLLLQPNSKEVPTLFFLHTNAGSSCSA